MQSCREVFSNSEFEIWIGFDDSVRDTVYFDEPITFLIRQTSPKHNFSNQELMQYIQNSLQIHFVCSFGDEDATDIPTQYLSQFKGSSKFERFTELGLDLPLIPIVGKEDKVLFSDYYQGGQLQPIFQSQIILYPLSGLLDIGRKRATVDFKSKIAITCHISEIPSEIVPEFDQWNCLYPLLKDDLFSTKPILHLLPSNNKITPFKKICHKIIPLNPLIRCTIHVSPISASKSIIGLEFSPLEQVMITGIHIEMPHSIIDLESCFPITINPKEKHTVLYSVRLLDDMLNPDERKAISFSVSLQNSQTKPMVTYFCGRLPMVDGSLVLKQQAANHGRLFESATSYQQKIFNGFHVSLSVLPPIQLQTVFSVKLLIANQTESKRNIIVEIFSGATLPKKSNRTKTPNMAMTPQEFIQEYQMTRTDAIICLEQSIKQSIPSKSCRLIMLHCIVIQGRVHQLPPIHITDEKTGERFLLKDTLTIHL